MSQQIRTYSQQHHVDGRHHELTLRRSDSFLYIEALAAKDPTELWLGETGVVYGELAKTLFTELRDKRYAHGSRMEPFNYEARIRNGATVERYSLGGKMHYEPCTDIETVTLYFRGHHQLDSFLNDLECCLSWAV
jgi:hypothetical protein